MRAVTLNYLSTSSGTDHAVAEEKLNPLSGVGDHYRIDGSSMEARSAVVHDTPQAVSELTSSSLLFANL